MTSPYDWPEPVYVRDLRATIARVAALVDELRHVGGGSSENHFGAGWIAAHGAVGERLQDALDGDQ